MYAGMSPLRRPGCLPADVNTAHVSVHSYIVHILKSANLAATQCEQPVIISRVSECGESLDL